jgi:hypothetical protein
MSARLLQAAFGVPALLLLVAAAPASAAAPLAPASMSPRQALYTWKLPKSGHIGAWSVGKDILHYDGRSAGRLTAPFNVAGITDFSVQAQMRSHGPGPVYATLSGFGLLLQPSNADPHASITAGSFFSDSSEDNNPEIAWAGQTIGGTAFSPGSAWHTYSLDVHGSQYSLSIDGKEMVTAAIPGTAAPSRVGVFSLYYQVDVRHFSVARLSVVTPQTPLDSAARASNLTVTDLPDSGYYQPYLRHWYTDEEVARERGVSLSSLQPLGRIASYGTEFFARSREVNDIYISVTSYSAQTGARQDMVARMKVLRQNVPQHTAYADLTGLSLGDLSDGYRVDISQSGISLEAIIVYVVHGRYTYFLRIAFDPLFSPDSAKNLAFTLSLAHIIDARIPR